MTQAEWRISLTKKLIAEQPRYRKMPIPHDEAEQRRLLRSLMNVRLPQQLSDDFLAVQDEYLREELAQKGITDIDNLTPVLKIMLLLNSTKIVFLKTVSDSTQFFVQQLTLLWT